jgi:3-dehydroquinate synthase
MGAGKTFSSVETIHKSCSKYGIATKEMLVSVGGGCVSDTVGFAAGTWNQGVPWEIVPTTLTGAVDASIGGKTSINTAAGKSSCGILHNPSGVFINLDTLQNLNKNLKSEGMAEVLKVSLTHGGSLLKLVKTLKIENLKNTNLEKCVTESVKIAVNVANGMYGPGGNKDVLSYGHELARGLEELSNYQITHGKAVGLGLMFSAYLEELLGIADSAEILHVQTILRQLELPSSLNELKPLTFELKDITQTFRHNKRMQGGNRFLLVGYKGPRQSVKWVENVSNATIQKAWSLLKNNKI